MTPSEQVESDTPRRNRARQGGEPVSSVPQLNLLAPVGAHLTDERVGSQPVQRVPETWDEQTGEFPMPKTITVAPSAPRYATIEEACEYSRLSRRSIERMIASGRLPRFNAGRRVLVDLNDLDAALRGVK